MRASYLFQQDKHYDVTFDTGDKTIQCGRHVDVFKLWLAWRAKVVNYVPKMITHSLCVIKIKSFIIFAVFRQSLYNEFARSISVIRVITPGQHRSF